MPKPPISNSVLVIVWLCLVALTIATFAVSKFSLGASGQLISLLIAIAKTTLVAAVFMELRSSGYRVRIIGMAGLVWAAILFAFTLSDFSTRDWIPTPQFWTAGQNAASQNQSPETRLN